MPTPTSQLHAEHWPRISGCAAKTRWRISACCRPRPGPSSSRVKAPTCPAGVRTIYSGSAATPNEPNPWPGFPATCWAVWPRRAMHACPPQRPCQHCSRCLLLKPRASRWARRRLRSFPGWRVRFARPSQPDPCTTPSGRLCVLPRRFAIACPPTPFACLARSATRPRAPRTSPPRNRSVASRHFSIA